MKKLTVEARKNPALNPKENVYQVLTDKIKTITDTVGGTTNLFVSFTSVDKLGIYPASPYNTPLGIYCYPAEYTMKVIGDKNETHKLPYQGDNEYANIFKATGNIIEVSNLPRDEEFKYYAKILSLWLNHYNGSRDPYEVIKSRFMCPPLTRSTFNSIMYDEAVNQARHNSPGGRLWYITMVFSDLFAKVWNSNNDAAAWAHLFRKLGVSGAVDLGRGIIHPNEPTQAVFFTKDAVTDIQRVRTEFHFKAEQGRIRKKKVTNSLVNLMTSPKVASPLRAAQDILSSKWDASKIIDLVKDPLVRLHMLHENPMLLLDMKNPDKAEQEYAFKSAIQSADSFAVKMIATNPKIDKSALTDALKNIPFKVNDGIISMLLRLNTQIPEFQKAINDIMVRQNTRSI